MLSILSVFWKISFIPSLESLISLLGISYILRSIDGLELFLYLDPDYGVVRSKDFRGFVK